MSFILEFNYQKLIYHVKKNNLYYRWWSCSTNRSFNRTSGGIIGRKIKELRLKQRK
jgi:hypothetical protein